MCIICYGVYTDYDFSVSEGILDAISINISSELASVTTLSNNEGKEHFWYSDHPHIFLLLAKQAHWQLGDCIDTAATKEPIPPVLEKRLLHYVIIVMVSEVHCVFVGWNC